MALTETQAIQMKIANELNALSEKTGMPVTQENGQRRYGPPIDHEGPPPPKGCEVFVGKVPRDVYEPELVPVFEKIGKIYELRLMMDFSGTNRGYCFVHYYSQDDAIRAVRDLNDFEIRKGRCIGVVKSVDNCRLFIGGLPKDKNEDDIFKEINKITEGVVRVIAYPSPADKTKNRGFAFVEYDSHKTAAMARRKMIPGKIPMWGMDVAVDWAEPEPNVDPDIMNKVQNLYVRNLMLSTTEDTLRDLFNEHSDNGVDKVKKIKDYAFVHFATRDQAEAAMKSLDNTDIEGSTVEITWAKPVNKATYKAQKALSKELYPPASVRMNARGNRNGPSSQRIFGAYQQNMNYQNSGLLPLPGQMNGGHMMTPPFIHNADYHTMGQRNNNSRYPRPRAAAGVQGIRMPNHVQQLVSPQPQPPSRDLIQYINSMTQPVMIPSEQYYGLPQTSPPAAPPVYPPSHHSPLKKPIQDLYEMCLRFGWGDPSFTTTAIAFDNLEYFQGMVLIPQHPFGPKECRCNNLFQDADDARASAADVMLRLVQADLAGAFLHHQQQMAAAASKAHYVYPITNPN